VAFDCFLQIDGIQGESVADKHKGELDIYSFSWGESHPVPSPGSGAPANSKPQFSSFSFMMKTSTATPPLMLACATGQHIKQAVLTCQKAGGMVPLEFLQVTFSDVQVESWQASGSAGGDDTPTESVSLVYGQVQFQYQQQDAKGGPAGPPVTFGWNVKANKKL
jgi:type VI secretion system secreted protein Hcp